MTEYKNMAICDLRNVTLESAAEIESITNIAVLVYPKNCSATRFLRNWDNIFEKNKLFLRSISEARSLASLTPF